MRLKARCRTESTGCYHTETTGCFATKWRIFFFLSILLLIITFELSWFFQYGSLVQFFAPKLFNFDEVRSHTKKTVWNFSYSDDDIMKPCAFLFFGRIMYFKDIVLPAIQKNIIEPNKAHHCDIYLHTYNSSHVNVENDVDSRKHFYDKVNVSEAFLLTPNVTMDTNEEFELIHAVFVNKTFRYTRYPYNTHKNLIKQWHSIDRVWNLMKENEAKILGTENGIYYKQIGFFRCDVYQVNEIHLFDSTAAAPSFASWGGINDRLFYGTRENAAIWANRFQFTDIFLQMEQNALLHAETYLNSLLKNGGVDVERKPICLWRIRFGGRLVWPDCGRDEHQPHLQYFFLNVTEMMKLAPPGFKYDGKYLSREVVHT